MIATARFQRVRDVTVSIEPRSTATLLRSGSLDSRKVEKSESRNRHRSNLQQRAGFRGQRNSTERASVGGLNRNLSMILAERALARDVAPVNLHLARSSYDSVIAARISALIRCYVIATVYIMINTRER